MISPKKFILTKTPLPERLQKTKTWILPGFEGVSVYEVINFFRKNVKWQSLLERASSIAYFFIMAMPPGLLFLFTIIPHLPFVTNETIRKQIHDLIVEVIPSAVHNQGVLTFVNDLLDKSRFGLLSFGIIAALFFASNAMRAIIRVFNKEYMGIELRKKSNHRFNAIKLTLLIFGLMFLYIVLLVFHSNVTNLFTDNETLIRILSVTRIFLIILLLFFSFSIIYRYAPTVRKRWKLITPGSVVATILSLVVNIAFAFFVSNFDRYNALYGAIGTVMMIMAIVFINSIILLIGFEVNVSIKSINAIKKIKAEKQKALEEKLREQKEAEEENKAPGYFSNNRLKSN